MTGAWPGYQPGTWKMTLNGVDGIALVTSGGTSGHDAVDSLRVLKSMLTGYGRDLRSLPRVWLPTDFSDAGDAESELMTCFDANRTVACSTTTGEGVLQGLAVLSQEVLQGLRDEFRARQMSLLPLPHCRWLNPCEVFVDSEGSVRFRHL